MSSVNNISEILENPELRSSYRRQLARALCTAKHYKGREKESDGLMQTLIELEKWLNRTFGSNENKGFPPEHENIVIEEWQKGSRRSIQDIMGLASSKFNKFLNSVVANDNSGNGILQVNADGVILPPGDLPVRRGNGDRKFEEARFQERLKELLMILNDNGVYTDDVVIVRGGIRESMMRKVSYAIIEIPKINREILICDQVGEATFVIYGILDRKTLLNKDKEALQAEYGGRVIKIVRRDPTQWSQEILGHLMKDVDIDSLKKINVREIEGLRTAIMEKMPTPVMWAGMKRSDKKNFKIAGMGLFAIATKFGVKVNPVNNHSALLDLGKKIYGDGHECLKYKEKPKKLDLTANELKTEILKEVPTPEIWAGMKYPKKEEFKIVEMGLNAIATKFGVKGHPIGNHSVHLEVGRKIYGEEHECLKYKKRPEITADKLRTEILKEVPTTEMWVGMKTSDKKNFKIAGMGLFAIATKFGVKGDPAGNHPVHLELGRKIYGEGHECLRYEDKPDLTAEDLRTEILKEVPAPELWAGMKTLGKGKLKIAEMGLCAIATQFGVKGHPISNHSVHLELGRKIYGEEHECLKYEDKPDLTAEELRTEILKEVPAPELWAGMKYVDKKEFKIMRMGLMAITSKFGVKGNPKDNHSFHLELGRKIYGEEHECLYEKEITAEELRTEILEKVPTPELWAGMKTSDKGKLKIAEMGLCAIATQFGVKGDPVYNHSVHLELGRKIYGEGHECLKKKG